MYILDRTVNFCNVFVEYGCIDAPVPPAGSHIDSDYGAGSVVVFDAGATYTCEDNYYFDEDHDQPNFVLSCNGDGTWDDPEPWTSCWMESGRFASC